MKCNLTTNCKTAFILISVEQQMWCFGLSMGPNVPGRAEKRKTIFQTSAASVVLVSDECPQQIKVAPWCPAAA
jgi:hypothetical protein